MSRRRLSPAQRRVRVIAVAVAALLAVLLAWLALRLLLGGLRASHKGGAGVLDPQFAEPAEAVTRPPELDASGQAPQLEDDPSLNWDQGEQVPVDMTADELVREAEAAH